MICDRGIEKRQRHLEKLRAEFCALRVESPVLPDLNAPKRLFEAKAWEARKTLREMKAQMTHRVLEGVESYLKNSKLNCGNANGPSATATHQVEDKTVPEK